MPQLDMSEALLEPMFQDSFIVVRRATSTNAFGETTITATSASAIGIVTIKGDEDLDRGADEQHAAKTIEVITRYPMRTATQGFQPDIVQWHGDNFIVQSIEDYSGYGKGWFDVLATSIDFLDLPQPV